MLLCSVRCSVVPPPAAVADTSLRGVLQVDRGWRTAKRPGLSTFLQALSPYFEIVVFTSAQPGYAMPILDRVDTRGDIMYRLYRDATRYLDGHHIKVCGSAARPVAWSLRG